MYSVLMALLQLMSMSPEAVATLMGKISLVWAQSLWFRSSWSTGNPDQPPWVQQNRIPTWFL